MILSAKLHAKLRVYININSKGELAMNYYLSIAGIYLTSFFYLHACFNFDQLPQAVITVPVADAVMRRMGECNIQGYYDLPYAEIIDSEAEICERGYQLLFNERVGIIERQGDEVRVCVPHIYYQPARAEKPLSSYWMLASNLTLLSELERNNCVTSLFPTVKHVDSAAVITHEIALRYPWSYKGVTYSAGTRFTILNEHDDVIVINVFNNNECAWEQAEIPVDVCVVAKDRSIEESISLMLTIVHSWAHCTYGVIPYVWGGASFTHVVKDEQYIIKRSGITFIPDREEVEYPKTGFDCSCIISRAAQLCNLPYWWGDSVTIQLHGIPVTKEKGIRAGDIIWIPGHVMMVSDIDNGLLIEARGYGSGYGKVHEISISEIFEGIDNYQDLFAAFEQQLPLAVLNSQGQVRRVYKEACIFDLRASLGC